MGSWMKELAELHAKHVLTPWSVQKRASGPMIVRGEGSFLYDSEGNRYLDLSAGLVAVNLGHGKEQVVQAIQQQAARLCYASPAFFHDQRALLAQGLSQSAPWPEGARTFFTTGGAEANEDAIKMARMITGRQKVLAFYRSFHGSTSGAGTLTGEFRRFAGEPGIPGVVHFWGPYLYRSPFFSENEAEESDRALRHLDLVLLHEDPTRVAAIVLEPVVGSNGVLVPPKGYLARVRELCNRHGILLVFDEVMTGFGRLGASFGAIRLGTTPDMITFAKGVTSAYVPLGGVLVREGLAATFDAKPLWCGHTYSGHPLAVAAGMGALIAYRDEGLFDRARLIEEWLWRGLRNLEKESPLIGEVRGLGAFFGLELVRDRETREPLSLWHKPLSPEILWLQQQLLGRGVYAFFKHNVMLIAPPLTITEEELQDGLEQLGETLRRLWEEPSFHLGRI
ncbi:taurine---2-oxoglutarate transaminase [Methylacidimicrobium cyclopophantes]|uniref:Taurine---2-oxoglutarate transaminase n=1 Tax=Methylacidimicrobium cyclopophantes TaxID=1041766 RepID=A0A5E6MB67_9BACT|nr:aminotransferase class III-fold pyridoxal phosphate-dependent enzyme [Methylacidimicrobium cyclopophantes]VVM06429.1 taurine---2-oxoglutarate transaminase [Methylacidimicrobium cyclopophantes]